jgi:hypothetical protein
MAFIVYRMLRDHLHLHCPITFAREKKLRLAFEMAFELRLSCDL